MKSRDFNIRRMDEVNFGREDQPTEQNNEACFIAAFGFGVSTFFGVKFY